MVTHRLGETAHGSASRHEGKRTEKSWEEPKLRAAETVVTGTTVAVGGGLLSAWLLGAGVFARGLGALVGQATAAVVRSIFSAVGGFLAR